MGCFCFVARGHWFQMSTRRQTADCGFNSVTAGCAGNTQRNTGSVVAECAGGFLVGWLSAQYLFGFNKCSLGHAEQGLVCRSQRSHECIVLIGKHFCSLHHNCKLQVLLKITAAVVTKCRMCWAAALVSSGRVQRSPSAQPKGKVSRGK